MAAERVAVWVAEMGALMGVEPVAVMEAVTEALLAGPGEPGRR